MFETSSGKSSRSPSTWAARGEGMAELRAAAARQLGLAGGLSAAEHWLVVSSRRSALDAALLAPRAGVRRAAWPLCQAWAST